MKRLRCISTALLAVSLAASTACTLDLDGTELPRSADASAQVDASSSVRADAASAPSDANAPHDASALFDAVVADASADTNTMGSDGSGIDCAGVLCDGVCIGDLSCASCAAGHALCPATHTCGDCSTCAGGNGAALPVACYACDATGQHPVGTCQADDTGSYCLDSVYPNGGTHCPCPNFDVATCPGSNQVCVQVSSAEPICVTCGESSYATNGAACQESTTCKSNTSPPRCK